MKILQATILFFLLSISSFAQRISRPDYQQIQTSEDTLKTHAWKIITAINVKDRFKADSIFTRGFVRTLKTKNSFYYTFDSLQTISQLYAPDSTFRIFTWQLQINDNLYRQHGAIQMRTADGAMKLFPLIDKSDVTQNIEDTVGNNYGWMGAVYYKIIQTQSAGQNYYTLIGFDADNIRSDRKIIEVLSFVNDEPVFGGHYFSVPNDKLIAKSPARYVMEFKKEAGPRLTYDTDMQMIIMEHLVSESSQPNKKYTLVGDGDYEGFKWANGRWVYVDKVFVTVTPEGQPPVPVPVNQINQAPREAYPGDSPAERPKPAPKKKN
ncbi:MAG: hypothetical protein QM737_21040 [Ferruginibacter sp.]